MLALLLFLQITPLSALFFDDYTGQVNLGVEINFNQAHWNLQTERIGVVVPAFSQITFDPISLSFWPVRYSSGVVLIVIRVCGHSVWRKSSYIGGYSPSTLIIPGSVVRLKSPCNHVQIEAHWQGEVGARFELAGTATLEP